MKRLITICAVIITILAVVPVVNATTVTYSGNYSGPTDVSKPIIISQFDPGLGTLLSATFTLYAAMNTSAFAVNDGDFDIMWDRTRYEFSLTGGTGYSSIAISASNPFSFPWTHITGLPNPNTWTQDGPTLTASNTFAESVLAAFIGTGNLSFLLTTHNNGSIGVGSNQTEGQPSPAWFGTSTDIIANASVIYDYTPVQIPSTAVPIPPTVWLLGSSLVGLAGFRKRVNS
jgi:hypothetical protein